MTDFRRGLIHVGLVAGVLAAGYLWLTYHLGGPLFDPSRTNSTPNPRIVLRPQDKEIIGYDANTHGLTVVTSDGTTTTYTRQPVIRIEKDNRVLVESHAYGFEYTVFGGLGLQYDGSIHPSIYFGVNFLELKAFDLGVAGAYSSDLGLRPLFFVGYNFYGNSSLAIGYGTHQSLHLLYTLHI